MFTSQTIFALLVFSTIGGLAHGNSDHPTEPAPLGQGEEGNKMRSDKDSEDAPQIKLWYGPTQHFGSPGLAQPWVNVLGAVSREDTETISLSYTLNGMPGRSHLSVPGGLNIGPHPSAKAPRRLMSKGDFNIDLDVHDLKPGKNQVEITASDTSARVTNAILHLNYRAGLRWPLPYEIEWDSVSDPQDVVQIVDGRWELTENGLRTVESGYDRVLAIGDNQWSDYEACVRVTFNEFLKPEDFPGIERDGIGFGLGQHWRGHTDNPIAGGQPKLGWIPTGGTCWYTARPAGATDAHRQFLQLEAELSTTGLQIHDRTRIQAGDTYCFKIRCETTPDGPLYHGKAWAESEPEPQSWLLTAQTQVRSLSKGSLIIVAHYVDVTIGRIEVIPVTLEH